VREVSEAHIEGSIGKAVVSTKLAILGGVSLIDNSMLADHLQEENAAISPWMERLFYLHFSWSAIEHTQRLSATQQVSRKNGR
jgi:hypothetical protein